jgi:hypothetical protein
MPDAVSDDGSWNSDNDDSEADKLPAIVAKRPSKVAAGKKAAAAKTMSPSSAKLSTPIAQNQALAVVITNAVCVQDSALSVPASVHMPAVPFETVDDLWIDGVDEDYGDD